MRPLRVAYSDLYQEWQLGDGHPTNPERARLACQMIDQMVPDRMMVPVVDSTMAAIARDAMLVHDRGYVRRLLLTDYESSEWDGPRPDLAVAAASLFAGTTALMRALDADDWAPGVSFNPMGAKHHAGRAAGSGFCVLNDHAWAAQFAMGRGKRVAVLDWDVHHGDGTEALLRGHADAATLSIHQSGIFPGTGLDSDRDAGVWNYPLLRGAGDAALRGCVVLAIDEIDRFKPDVLLLAAGADGLGVDPLGGLDYSLPGLFDVAALVGEWAARRGVPVVVGGAGGYTPLRETPMAYAGVVATLVAAFQGHVRPPF